MVVGSPAFQAPEALADPYLSDDESDSSAEGPQKEDIWALGVTLYQLLFLKFPFIGDNLYEVVNCIKEHPVVIPRDCDPRVAELLRRMLTVDPGKRIGVDELRQNPLIADAPDLAEGLPEVPAPSMKDGEIVELEAKICDDGYSFASTPLLVPRRSSYHVHTQNFNPAVQFHLAWPVKAPRHSDGEDEDPV
jgi:serine/threonine protein kinase